MNHFVSHVSSSFCEDIFYLIPPHGNRTKLTPKPTDESSDLLKLIANPETGLVRHGHTAAAHVLAAADVVGLAGGVVVGRGR